MPPKPARAACGAAVDFVRAAPRRRRRRGAIVLARRCGRSGRFARSGPNEIENDFSKLRRADTWKNGEGYWGRKMDALLGTYLTPTVILTDDAGPGARHRPRRARAVEGGRRSSAMVASVADARRRRPAASKTRRSPWSTQIREDAHAEDPLAHQRRTSARRSTASSATGLCARSRCDDLPHAFTTGLRERDGTVGRTVLVYPRPGARALAGAAARRTSSRGLRDAAAVDGRRPSARRASPGRIALSARHPHVDRSATALIASAAVVRRRGASSSSLSCAGEAVDRARPRRRSCSASSGWRALAMALGIKINFANFIAFPITFGIGVDYAVNVMSR